MKKFIITVIICMIMSIIFPLHATELRDPYLRDDDISGTEVSVSTSRNTQGLYIYNYDVKAPLENTGSILYFAIDISCQSAPDARGFDPAIFPSDASPSLSSDGNHVPVAINAPWGASGIFGISAINAVH